MFPFPAGFAARGDFPLSPSSRAGRRWWTHRPPPRSHPGPQRGGLPGRGGRAAPRATRPTSSPAPSTAPRPTAPGGPAASTIRCRSRERHPTATAGPPGPQARHGGASRTGRTTRSLPSSRAKKANLTGSLAPFVRVVKPVHILMMRRQYAEHVFHASPDFSETRLRLLHQRAAVTQEGQLLTR